MLRHFIVNRLHQLGLTRKDVPQLLGYRNTSKCLRNLDRFLAGDFSHKELSYRILHSPLGGDDFRTVLLQAQHQRDVDLRELSKVRELKERSVFSPHLFFIHERSIPSPIHAVAFVGAEHFKKMELPAYIQEKLTCVDCLDTIEKYLISYVSNPPSARYMNSLFGKAVQILFRDTYDHAFVFDISELRFVGHFKGVPKTGHATLTHKGSRIWE